MMPCSCAASSASAICLAIGSASAMGIGPRAMTSEQIFALDQFHHERVDVRRAVRRFDDAVDLRDVRVVERGERLRFARRTAPRDRYRGRTTSGRILIATSRLSFVSRAR